MRLSLILLAGLALAAAGCDRKPEAPAASPPATAPDPDAPAPGTQAAEAIGADSDDNAAVLPPDKKPH
ncbi:hypothetical protein [Brevundimonas sp.]|jgi:hypothetical protein|uniref:hypothetical protein n=1 Tax=Brevundimonas sp. TaxID=1871086 RepID=UPI003782D5BA